VFSCFGGNNIRHQNSKTPNITKETLKPNCMKKLKSILLIALALAGCTTSLFAYHWRVSNVPGASANYTTLQAAHNDALVMAGDTLYVEPSGTVYSDLHMSKPLVIIGNGYLLAANPETQANTSSSRIDHIYIYSGASGSYITGCDLAIILNDNVHNIFIKRNKGYGLYTSNGICGGNIYVIQNFFEYVSFGNAGGIWSNVSIQNNIINSLQASASATILSNVITGWLSATNSTLENNIQSNGSSVITNCYVHNNIGSTSQFGTENGNISNVNMNDVFLCFSNCSVYSADGRYQLKEGSVAAGAGVGGIDCGIFDGDYPYVLSGIPTIPAIYSLTVLPQGDSLNVSVKVKSHN
jgi:hypothetical protein